MHLPLLLWWPLWALWVSSCTATTAILNPPTVRIDGQLFFRSYNAWRAISQGDIVSSITCNTLTRQFYSKIDLLGIFIAVIGAVTVVLSSNTSNVRLGPDALVRAVSQHVFVVYSLVYTVGAIVLAVLSEGRIGRQWVIVDVGLCALFGVLFL